MSLFTSFNRHDSRHYALRIRYYQIVAGVVYVLESSVKCLIVLSMC